MSWQTEALGGPVLAWDARRVTRRRLWLFLRLCYCAWLVIQAFALTRILIAATWDLPEEPRARLAIFASRQVQQANFCDNYYVLLLQFQLVLICALTPALLAGSLGQEKERGTLFALFGTQLTSSQILLGKLLGRLLLILPLIVGTLPALVFLATMAGRSLLILFLALLQEVVLAFALGAVCLLFGIWVRRATDAVVACYLFLCLAYLIVRAYTLFVLEAFWFDPLRNLGMLLSDGSVLALSAHLAVWLVLGIFCVRLGSGYLRKVCVDQRDKSPSRRLWAFRPAVGDDPIRWRECHVIGLAPMPILRIVPRWLALLMVFTFSAAVAGIIANSLAPGFLWALVRIELDRAFTSLWEKKSQIKEFVPLMGLVFVLLVNLLIGVRCGTSVAEEKRRNTWDDLLLTAHSFRDITTGKMWGVLSATVPYIIAYAVPVFMLALVGGPGAFFTALMWIGIPCALVFGSAHLGIDMLRVPPDMNETREGGAFWFENEDSKRRRYQQVEGWGP
jgi:ABC-type transport system involved in multi-copper enzyme maturation permease subunit